MQQGEALITVVIVQKRLEADGIVSVQLRSTDGAPLPSYEAGAHIDLVISADLVRQYSLCPPLPQANTYEIAVLREPQSRGGSQAVHDQLQVGQTIQISAPRNHFPLKPATGRTLLFAGGIGITPILAMADESARLGRDFDMHYCGRSASRMAYVEQIRASDYGAKVAVHVDDGAEDQKLNLAEVLASPAAGDQLYVCGPAGFITAVLDTAAAQGWAESQLNREFFAAPVHESEGEDQAFEVVLQRSGKTVPVPVGVSIVEALDAQGIMIPVSCSEGICGMCVVSVLDGTPDHRDFVLSADEHARNDCLTACCSRAKSASLVLDL